MTQVAIVKNEIAPDVKSLIERIQAEIEQGKQRTYWNVGKHLKEHLLENAKRANYGDYLINQVAEALNIGKSILYDSIKFHEEYPNIFHARGKLTWTHIRTLLTIPEKEIREAYEEKIVQENLNTRDLKLLIKKDNVLPKSPRTTPLLPVDPGEPWVYRLKKIQNKMMVDLGFRFFMESPFQSIKNEAVIRVEKKNREYKFTNTDTGVVPHYIYKAYLLDILDGDTIWVDIDLGFSTWTTQKLRLKGINTSAIETPKGQNAKDYIEAQLGGCRFIAVKTYWRDKFTRYLADIFYDKKETDFETLVKNGHFLNQELLDQDLAVRF